MLVALQIVLLLLIAGSVGFYAWCAIIAIGRFFATPIPEIETVTDPALSSTGLERGGLTNFLIRD